MTRGRTKEEMRQHAEEKTRRHLTGFSIKPPKSLESRVASLEARMSQLEEAVDRASGVMPAHFYEAIHGAEKRKPGPREKIDDTELLLNRDNIVTWLEERWPKIVKPLLAAKTPRQVAAVLREIAATADIRPEWQRRFVGHPAELCDFLRSVKFRVKPPRKTVVDALYLTDAEKRMRAANRLPTRQIANAMGGVPKLKWRTSLDKCSKNPSSYRVGHNVAQHYRTMFGIFDGKPSSGSRHSRLPPFA